MVRIEVEDVPEGVVEVEFFSKVRSLLWSKSYKGLKFGSFFTLRSFLWMIKG